MPISVNNIGRPIISDIYIISLFLQKTSCNNTNSKRFKEWRAEKESIERMKKREREREMQMD